MKQETKKPPKPAQKPKLSVPSGAKQSESVMTDPESLYRKLYNKSLAFFLWVIEVEPAPSIFKLHITANSLKEMNMAMTRNSVEALIESCGSHAKKPKIIV